MLQQEPSVEPRTDGEMETYDRELDIGGVVRVAHSVSKFIDILDPLLVTLQFVSGEANNLDTSFLEFLLLARDFAKLRRADLVKEQCASQSKRRNYLREYTVQG